LLLGTLLGALNVLGFVWVTYDVIKKQKLMPESAKSLWIFMAFLFGSFVALLYALSIKLSGKYEEVEIDGDESIRVW